MAAPVGGKRLGEKKHCSKEEKKKQTPTARERLNERKREGKILVQASITS